MKLKLHRDRVVSVVNGKELVGVYVRPTDIQANSIMSCGKGADGVWFEDVEILLAEMSPSKADKIIKLWNSK